MATHARIPLAAAVDAGTTGARAIAYDLTGRLVAEVRRPYRIRGRGQIRAIGLTGQCPTMVVADERGRPLRAGMLYRDNRAVAEARDMRARIGDQVMHQRTGHLPEAFHVGPKLMWIRRHEPDIFARVRLVFQARDVVLQRLTDV